jgi:hypothetical protein
VSFEVRRPEEQVMDRETRAALIDRYRSGYDEVVRALEGITEAEWDFRPAPGQWSARQVIHHLADSEMTSAIRLRLLVAQDHPTISGYDQNVFAETLFYDRPVDASLLAFRAARASTAEILDRLSDEQFARTGTHTEVGAYGVERWLELYAAHAHGHADQIRRARQAARG